MKESTNKINKTETIKEIDFFNEAKNFLRRQPDNNYLLLLSGGQSPFELYKNLSVSYDYPFPKDIFLVDERTDFTIHQIGSNYKMINDSGLFERATKEYFGEKDFFADFDEEGNWDQGGYSQKLMNLVEKYDSRVISMMSMGVNGHVAGILPYTDAVNSKENVVMYVSEDVGSRITITPEFILNKIGSVLLLLIGDEKISKFGQIWENETDINQYPVLIFKDHEDFSVLCLSQ